VETYNQHFANSESVAMIHVSYDKSNKAAEKWAAKAKFPWLTILPTHRKASGFTEFSKSDYVPEYQLIDAQGKALAPEGKEAVAKAIELSQKEVE